MNKIEHIGIAVKNLDEAIKTYTELLGTECYKTEAVESEGVKTAFFQVGESKIELLEASNENSPIAKFIEKKGEGIHHIAFDVEDIEAEIKRLRNEGFSATDSDRALIKLAARETSFAHTGTRPHDMTSNCTRPSMPRKTYTSLVGEILKFRDSSALLATAEKACAISCAPVLRTYLPHMLGYLSRPVLSAKS